MSLSGRPGNFGTTFHNYLYEKLGLNFIYKAFTTQDIEHAVKGIRALGVRGCAVSMPFKESCMPFLDEIHSSAKAIESVNTIVNDDGFLRAYNTDYIAIVKLIEKYQLNNYAKTGRYLAALYGYEYIDSLVNQCAEILVNVTPIGMKGGKEETELAFPQSMINAANIAFDVVAIPAETPFIRYAESKGKKVISGAEVIVLQAVEQFELYTHQRPSNELIEEAAAFARTRS